MELSIVLPTLNEAKNVKIILPRIRKVMKNILELRDFEILIIDSGSKDDIRQVALENKVRLIEVNRGYGIAVKAGIKASRGRYVIMMDADLSHNPYIIPNLYSHREEAEILIASRFIKTGYNNTHLSRRVLSKLLNWTYRMVLDFPVRDMSSGYRLYHKKIFQDMKLRGLNYVVLQEILTQTYAQGYTIKEIPFHYHPRKYGSTKSRLIKFGVEYVGSLYQFWRQRNSIESADYDERAFHSRVWFQRYWQRKRYEIICDYCKDFDSILDVGCGSSQIMDGLPQAIGCDVKMNKLRYKRSPFRKLARASVYALPFPDDYFECVIFSQVIEHLPKDPVILDEVVRVAKKDSVLVIGTPDYATWWTLIEKIYGFFQPSGYADEHITHYTRKSLIAEMEKRDCEYIDHRYVLGAELIVRFRKK